MVSAVKSEEHDLIILHTPKQLLLTHLLTDGLGLLHAVDVVSHVDGVAVILVLDPLRDIITLRAAVGL